MILDFFTFKFDSLTVEHLGSRIYSHLLNAIAELIANAYDADARHIRIEVRGSETTTTISVIDGRISCVNCRMQKFVTITANFSAHKH